MLYLIPKVESMIVAPLEMVSPMFITLLAVWSQVIVVGAHSIFAQCACQGVSYSYRHDRDQVHRLCWWENTNRTKWFVHYYLALGTMNKIKLIFMCFALYKPRQSHQTMSRNVAIKTFGRSGYLTLRKDSLPMHIV